MDFSHNRWVGAERAYGPVRCMDVELGEPIHDVVERDYKSVHILVRFHGEPVGAVALPFENGRCTASAIRRTIVERLGHDLVRLMVRRALDRPLPAIPLDADQLAHPEAADELPLPGVTVAVCTHGQADLLPRCLDGILRSDHPDLEVIIVDNSPDRRDVERIVNARVGVRYEHEPGAGLDRARNRAIVAATRGIIAFTDDDVIVDPGWASAIARRFAASPEVHAITGLVLPLELETEPQLMFERYLGFGRGFTRRWVEDVNPIPRSIALRFGNTGRLGTGANMAFRRSVLATIGGFDPALDLGTVTNGGGDLDMFFRVIKAGGALVYEPSALVRHRHRREWHELEAQLNDWGTAMRSYVERNRNNYPEERVGFAVLVSWLLATWHLRRLTWSLVDPHLSTRLVFEEIRGLLGGKARYRDACVFAGDVARTFGASVPHPRAATRITRRNSARYTGTVSHDVELSEPISSLVPVGHPTRVRFRLRFHGRLLGGATLAHRDHVISADRIRDVAARTLAASVGGLPLAVSRRDDAVRALASRVVDVLQSQGRSRPRAGASKNTWRSRASARR